VERVRENAERFGVPFSLELKRVIFHGALHLMGYKDKKKVDQVIMRKKEEEWLSAYAVSRNTVS
jgi:rRNA maturation RNase YbeY